MQQLCVFAVCSIRILCSFRRPLDSTMSDAPGASDHTPRWGAMRLFRSPTCSLIYGRGLKCVQQSLLWA
jgi:hypothetical protein